MTVTELALLKLKKEGAIDGELKALLKKAQSAMESFSGHKFYYLRQVEDPTCVYVLGEWASLSQHYDGFIPSKQNQDLLEALKDELEVGWLSHLDVPISDIQLDAPVLSLGRHTIKDGQRDGFANCFTQNRKYLDDFVTEGTLAGGWKLDDNREAEEFVLFAPWSEVAQHIGFASTEGFKEYRKIREYVGEADIKHVKILDI